MGRINLVGLEVEGGWEGKRRVRKFPDVDIISDLSIDGNTLPTDRRLTTTHVGEVVSKPMSPEGEAVEEWIDTYWPDDANNTCGYHIHTSFHNKTDYALLTTKSFLLSIYRTIYEKGKELNLDPNHYLWARLAGRNPFCMFNFDSSSQIAMKRKSVGDRTRYGMLNFAWNIHSTVEFRVFPTFETREVAKTFTRTYLNAIEDFLEQKQSLKNNLAYVASLSSVNGVMNFILNKQEVS